MSMVVIVIVIVLSLIRSFWHRSNTALGNMALCYYLCYQSKRMLTNNIEFKRPIHDQIYWPVWVFTRYLVLRSVS